MLLLLPTTASHDKVAVLFIKKKIIIIFRIKHKDERCNNQPLEHNLFR